MTFGDLVDLMEKSGARVDHYWGFSVGVTVAVIGWLLSMPGDWPKIHDGIWLLVAIIYAVVMVLCTGALWNEYRVFLPLVGATKAKADFVEDPDLEPVMEAIRALRYPWRPAVVLGVHGAYLALVFALIWYAAQA